MAERKDKKFYRELKRDIKKEGNKRRRAYYKHNLTDNPEEAHWCDEYDFGGLSSKMLNGIDNDATRRRDDEKNITSDDRFYCENDDCQDMA